MIRDLNKPKKQLLKFEQVPASRHAWRRLVDHILEMWHLYLLLPKLTNISSESVLKVIILHDIHKSYHEYGYDKSLNFFYSIRDRKSINSVIRNAWLINKYKIDMNEDEMHAVLASG